MNEEKNRWSHQIYFTSVIPEIGVYTSVAYNCNDKGFITNNDYQYGGWYVSNYSYRNSEECFVMKFKSKLTKTYNYETNIINSYNKLTNNPISVSKLGETITNKIASSENDYSDIVSITTEKKTLY